MASECSTDSLRALAPRWMLAGDDKLLDLLQNTHKNIVSKCEDVNSKLEQMSAALDDASISLQNVNNKFLALSNSQFIESRVYDDDADVSTEITPVKETPQKPQSHDTDLEALKKSLSILQNLHETVTILKDSDTETDSDGEDGDRVVLKPKDLYSDRPLPYIIGSQAWKNSWHAGLIPEDSDTESGSAGREPQSPQYSDSEPEDTPVISKANATISEASSDLASEQDVSLPAPKPTAADIAADLARRLGGNKPKIEPESEYSPPKIISKTIYKPQQPQTGIIFADEPPPLDSETESSNDDIFAELHNNRSKERAENHMGRGFDAGQIVPQPRIEQRPLFEDTENSEDRPVKKNENKTASKKPVGGISVFGANKGAESIGAAILKRNKRKSTSEEDTDSEDLKPPPKPKATDTTDSMKKEKDIFDDLFAQSANLEKKKTEKDKEVKSAKDKVDLFSDNLFDDLGDVFTTNVMKNKSNQKSIFDDDDDLFADIAPVKVNKSAEVRVKNNKSIFDSDDELFADKPVLAKTSKETENNRNKKPESVNNDNKVEVTNTIKVKSNKSIFESDDELFTDKPVIAKSSTESTNILNEKSKSVNNNNKLEGSNTITVKDNKSIFESDEELFVDKPVVAKSSKESENNRSEKAESIYNNNKAEVSDTIKVKDKSIFESDDELFTDKTVIPKSSMESKNNRNEKPASVNSNNKVECSNKITVKDNKGIFESDDELFVDEPVVAKSSKESDINRRQKPESESNQLAENNIFKVENNKSIYESDDELFADKPAIAKISKEPENNTNKIPESVSNKNKLEITNKVIDRAKDNRDILESDDELFTDKSTNIAKPSKESHNINKSEKLDIINKGKSDVANAIINKENIAKNVVEDTKPVINEPNTKSAITKNIFDSDSDSDVFSNLAKNKDPEKKDHIKDIAIGEDISKNTSEAKKDLLEVVDKNNLRSPSLFDDDDDALFSDTTKVTPKDSNTKPKDEENVGILRDSEIIPSEIPLKSENFVSPQIARKTTADFDEKDNNLDRKENQVSKVPSANNLREDIFESKSNEQLHDAFDKQDERFFESKESESKAAASEEPNINVNQKPIDTEMASELKIDVLMPDNKHANLIMQKDVVSKDIFDDEPPIFEKPKEPKRSKNVNALFDDDSEDEALFFRKSDMDDKTENFSSTVQSDNLFGIFHDEPPAIDDFGKENDAGIFNTVSKPKGPNISKEIDDIDDLPSVQSTKNKSYKNINNDFDDLFKTENAISEATNNKYNAINIHGTLSEIKEDEFDDIFKAANKVVNTESDDILKLTVDELVKNTTKSQPEYPSASTSEATDIFGTSILPEKSEAEKPEIDFDSDEELFRTLPKPEEPKVPEFKNNDELDKGALIKEEIDVISKLDKPIFKPIDRTETKKESVVLPKNELDNLDEKPVLRKKDTNKNNDVKKVGRIKSLNLNIDVSTLLPGASPKKQKFDSTKESPKSDTTSEEITKKPQENDPKMVKSISFEDEPNSEILDNKLSKERAKIQVKRRPSTRKARREAVRKSVIDLDDSTDNSSSIDDAPKSVESESPIKTKTVPNESSSKILNEKKSLDNIEIPPEMPKIIDKVPEKPKVTSKVVYILNDEDIFDTKPKDKTKNPVIPTLGSMYGGAHKTDKNDNIAKKSSKVSIFDTDSDEELFGGKSKSKKQVQTKSSLFDDVDDDNLFGTKSKKADTSQPHSSKSVSNIEKSTEPVFSDPLSMLDDD